MMALIRRRHPNLCLPISKPIQCRPHFPLYLTLTTTKRTTNDAITIDDLVKLIVLGHGNGRTVYKVYHKVTSITYELKIIHGEIDAITHCHALLEASILRYTIDCLHVDHFHSSFEMPIGDVAILMEYMGGGSLETALTTNSIFFEE
ncbi:hypothetical protein JHK87_018032 [Glycine soja]|nr:hypothetical protein JHK87_018032 [Glycine soja]